MSTQHVHSSWKLWEFLLLKQSLLRREGMLIQGPKFTCRPGQNSVFMASLLLLQGQERSFTVQKYFHWVLLNLVCKTLHRITLTVNKFEQMTKAIPLAPWDLHSPLQCSRFSDSAQSVASGNLRSWRVQPTIHRWCMHIWLIKSHRLFAPVLVPDQLPVNVALSSGGAAVFFQLCPLNWPVSTCIHYCHSNFSLKAEVTIPSSLRDQTGDMDSEACLVRHDRTWWGPWQTADCPPSTQQMRQLQPVPTWSLPCTKWF